MDSRATNPKIADIIESDFYVDDLLTGADSEQEAIHICTEVSNILKGGCFQLRKWQSNNQSIIDNLNEHTQSSTLRFCTEEKTLGLIWSNSIDCLMYETKQIARNNPVISKRIILSDIAKIFDPLGLLSPCIVFAKILLQKLWLTKLSWDDPVSKDIEKSWQQFQSELPHLNELQIPRHTICENPVFVELHCFADASQTAYGGCIYVRSIDSQQNPHIHLLCLKSKVAPLKTLTMPRLELCAALVVSRLAKRAYESLKVKSLKCTFWSDSTIVLGWLKMVPNQLKTFVSNRVAEIQLLTQNCDWKHVSSNQNPADLLSRGVMPGQIKSMPFWWNGPAFLAESSISESKFDIAAEHLPEVRNNPSVFVATEITSFPFETFSSLVRLKRTVAYILRFKHNSLHPEARLVNSLSVKEINDAFTVIIKFCKNNFIPVNGMIYLATRK